MEGYKIVFDEMEGAKQSKRAKRSENLPVKLAKVSARGSATTPTKKKQKNSGSKPKDPVQADFIDGGQFMSMSVESAEETLFQTESSDDDDSEGNSSQSTKNTSDSDSTNSNSDENSNDSQSDDSEGEIEEERINTRQALPQAMKRKIQELDEGMVMKMEELEKLMVEGRLSESAKVLKRCMEANKKNARETPPQRISPHGQINDQRRPSGLGKQEKRKNHSGREDVDGQPKPISEFLNKNDNHKKSQTRPIELQSAETIYHNAVQKRSSTSSDEINTSDDCVQLQISSDFISEEQSPIQRQSMITAPVPQPQPLTSNYREGCSD